MADEKFVGKDDEVGSHDIQNTASSDHSSTADEFRWTPEEEGAVRRKLDTYIVPLTTFLYLLCFLDRHVELVCKFVLHIVDLNSEPTLETRVSRGWLKTST